MKERFLFQKGSNPGITVCVTVLDEVRFCDEFQS